MTAKYPYISCEQFRIFRSPSLSIYSCIYLPISLFCFASLCACACVCVYTHGRICRSQKENRNWFCHSDISKLRARKYDGINESTSHIDSWPWIPHAVVTHMIYHYWLWNQFYCGNVIELFNFLDHARFQLGCFFFFNSRKFAKCPVSRRDDLMSTS